jgi:hypothetical protein
LDLKSEQELALRPQQFLPEEGAPMKKMKAWLTSLARQVVSICHLGDLAL